MRFQTKKNKSTQYVIGGTVAVIILGLWISLPLMSGSSLDSSVSTGNPFRSKVADISLLGSDISSEGGAPGSPLSGDMINNPATSGEEIASSLFESGPGSDEPAVAVSADASAAPAASPMASAGAPAAPSGPRGRLSAAASITAGNSSSMSSGGKHDKFFGTGNQKSEFAPAAPAGAKTAQTFSAEQETRLNEAVTLAFSEGIEKAIELIKKDDSAYLVDALHDKLVDELYQRLIQAGKLKEM